LLKYCKKTTKNKQTNKQTNKQQKKNKQRDFKHSYSTGSLFTVEEPQFPQGVGFSVTVERGKGSRDWRERN